MIPILYNNTETDFTRNGIGWLKDCTKCTSTEELKGIFECEFSYPITGNFYKEIIPDRIVKVKPNETATPQLFKIYRTSKPINGIVKIYCQHISYDLNGNTVTPFTLSTTNATTVLNAILDHCYYAHRFTAVSYSNTRSKFELKIPVSARKCLGGMEGSVLDNFKGEFEFDNFTIKHYNSRGQDNGVTIQYGKNLTDITADTSIADVYTSVYPYATDEDGDYYELPEKVIELPSKSSYGEPRTLPLDLSDKFDSETRITSELLRQYANAYISNNKIDEIKQNIKISFIQLWQSKEYETISILERVRLGDIVTVKYPALGVSVKAKVIKTTYDVLNEKYTEIELGQAKSNFANTLNKVNSGFKVMSDFIRNQPSLTEKAIAHATERITGGLGGYVVINQNDETGYPEEILIMDKPDKTTAVNVWRFNKGGLGHSHNGYNGDFDDIALTDDGRINASMITAGVLNADLIKAGTIQDVNGNMSINMLNGKIRTQIDTNVMEIWTGGVTIKNRQSKVLTSMFVSANNTGVLTANTILVGERDSEKTTISVNSSNKGYVLTDIVSAGEVYTDKVSIGNIDITKNSNNRLSIDAPVVSNFSVADDNGNEIGSFYAATNNRSYLRVNDAYVGAHNNPKIHMYIDGSSRGIVSADGFFVDEIILDGITISKEPHSGKLQASQPFGGNFSVLAGGGVEVGSFYLSSTGKSVLNTNVLQVDGYQYASQAVTINGTTYYVLART